jgi:hypothetical protein
MVTSQQHLMQLHVNFWVLRLKYIPLVNLKSETYYSLCIRLSLHLVDLRSVNSADFGAVEGKLLCSKFILEVGSHFYGEFPLQKNIILGH